MTETPSLEERIAQIQLNAYSNLGLSPPEIGEYFKTIQQQIEKFVLDQPDYLSKAFNSDLHSNEIELDLNRRLTRDVPTPFQEPFIHSWLEDIWHYHRARVYQTDSEHNRDLVLATAPTGRFNAIAIPDNGRNGILIEEGLLYLSRLYSSLLAELLYEEKSSKLSYIESGDELQSHLENNYEIVERIVDSTLDYLTNGKINFTTSPLMGMNPSQAESAANSMFCGMVSFVIEHELHHLLARPEGKHVTSNVTESFENLWKIFTTDIIPFVETTIEKSEVKQLFESHQEEILADHRAINLVFTQAQKDKKIWPKMDGPMMFFHLIDFFRWGLLKISNPERLEQEAKLDGKWLSISALLHGESHPYPLVRRAGVLSVVNQRNKLFGEILVSREKRFIQIFNFAKQLYDQKTLPQNSTFSPSKKWSASHKNLTACR